MNDLLVSLGLQLGAGGVSGFALGYGLKKITRLLLTALSILTALFMLPLMWLVNVGVITVNWTRFAIVMEETATWIFTGFSNVLGQWSVLAGSAALGGGFAAGLALGLKQG